MNADDMEVPQAEDELGYHSVGDHAAHVRQELAQAGEDALWEVVLDNETTLLLDYDSPAAPAQFFTVLSIIQQVHNPCSYRCYKSRSGNTHVIVRLPAPMTALERIAWQAAFGSDCKREALYLNRITIGDTNINLLVMRKDRDELTPSGE